MKKIFRKYSISKLMDITGLPRGFICGCRKRIFRNAMNVSLENLIKEKVILYQNKF